jgi:2-(1,2-epoxy-1,2-dihydrophenyl)acetyl-CoA isomerase
MSNPAGTLFEVDADGIATLTLREPARLNPITTAIQQGTLAALERVRDDATIRALVLTGSGKAFCVGADLDQLAEWSQQAKGAETGAPSVGEQVGDMMQRAANPIIMGLHELPVPVVCAINGPAVGGGFGFALAGDIVIAAQSSYFYLPFVPALGLVPDMGASWRLPRAVGHARAMGIALLGERVTAAQAAQWGLIWACVDDADLMPEALRLAQRLAALPAHSAQETRALFRAAAANTLPEQLGYEMQRQRVLINGESFAEGLKAFQEKRKASFARRR